MSKKKKVEQKETGELIITNGDNASQEIANPIPNFQRRGIQKHQQCPVCFNGLGGVGKQKNWQRISGLTTKIHYICDQCGFSWAAVIKKVVIEIQHQDVQVEHQQGPSLETRDG